MPEEQEPLGVLAVYFLSRFDCLNTERHSCDGGRVVGEVELRELDAVAVLLGGVHRRAREGGARQGASWLARTYILRRSAPQTVDSRPCAGPRRRVHERTEEWNQRDGEQVADYLMP